MESNYTFAFMLLEPLRLVRMSRMMAAFASTRLPLGVMTSHQPQILNMEEECGGSAEGDYAPYGRRRHHQSADDEMCVDEEERST